MENLTRTFTIQDTSKQSGNNLLDFWACDFDASPEDAMTFSSESEANDYIQQCNYQSFASVVELA